MATRLTAVARFANALWFTWVATTAPVGATAERTYRKGEYAIINGGLSPNRRLSIAAHGEGEGGFKNFHVYLMSEPAHIKTARLDAIGPDNVLDTAPEAIKAVWSNDSHHVAVLHRPDRHVVEMRLYTIENRHARPIVGPSLFRAVTKSNQEPDENDLRSRVSELSWIGPGRFVLKETRLLHTSIPGIADRLGQFGKLTADAATKSTDDRNKPVNWYFVDFSAEAICELRPGNTYRIIELKPGAFDKR